jgi:hypothetical protein
MPGVSRRTVLGAAAAGLGTASIAALPAGRAFASPCRAITARPTIPLASLGADSEAMAQRFLPWLRRVGVARDRQVKNLPYNFYDTNTSRGEWIYPMLAGKAILWLVARGQIDEAWSIAATLLHWQQRSSDGRLARSYGAFPSKITPAPGGYLHGDRYYSGDNLVILEALLALHRQSRHPELLNSAIGIGTWLVSVMCQGRKFGVWTDDLGAPMQMVTRAGDFSNQIHTNVEMAWLIALHHLGQRTGDASYCRQAERAFAFLRQSQHPSGAYFDHYDPGYPPKPYQPTHWKPYAPGQLISDNVLRAALGACRFGDTGGAAKLMQWLKTESGAVYAYLDQHNGGSGFEPTAKPYFDVTSTGLHRSVCQWLGMTDAAKRDIAFLRKHQDRSGCWYWGLFRDSLQPVEPQLAPMTGFWATADLSIALV